MTNPKYFFRVLLLVQWCDLLQVFFMLYCKKYMKQNQIISIISFFILPLLAGCWSSSSSSNNQTIFFSDYMMTVNEWFVSIPIEQISDRRLNWSLIAAYSIPTPSSEFFEKNIIISQDTLGNLSLDDYVTEAVAWIQTTWGGYGNASISSQTVSCNDQSLQAKKHSFTIQRWLLGTTWQLLSFVQYFFAKSNKITILSSSTDDANDLDAINSYMDSVQCSSWSTTT